MAEDKEKEEEKPIVAKTAVDLQRLKLMKLMKNPEKPIIVPERPKAKNTPSVPEFVRNVMGSSAGAGSGEFHVYRHLRRKEYARQKFIKEKGRKELLDDEYHQKLEENKRKAEEQTAKKRAKRLKKKQKYKERKRVKGTNINKDNQNEHSHTEEDEEESSSDENKAKESDVSNAVSEDMDHMHSQNANGPENENSEVRNECKTPEPSIDPIKDEQSNTANVQREPIKLTNQDENEKKDQDDNHTC